MEKYAVTELYPVYNKHFWGGVKHILVRPTVLG